MNVSPPENPIGPFDPVIAFDPDVKQTLIKQLEDAPSALRAATEDLTDEQLDTKYRNWTVRQITHHVADSHVHSYIRFKWVLTEPNPTIKAYEEADWVLLDDGTTGTVDPSSA